MLRRIALFLCSTDNFLDPRGYFGVILGTLGHILFGDFVSMDRSVLELIGGSMPGYERLFTLVSFLMTLSGMFFCSRVDSSPLKE